MARQQLVRALVPEADADALRTSVLELPRAEVGGVTLAAPDPATYRDERPDRRLRELVVGGGMRLATGVVLGALLGAAVVLLVPGLRDWLPYTLIIGILGGAWGGGATAASRGMQVLKPEDDEPEDLHDVDREDAARMRVMTVVVHHDRDAVVDLLTDRGAVLLDAWHPKVGHGPDARPDHTGPDDEDRPPGEEGRG